MVNRTTKLRWRRRFKRGQRRVENLSVNAEQSVEKHFFKRLNKLSDIRRFVAAWTLLIIFLGAGLVIQVRALSPYYQTVEPIDGGIYTEGIIGRFTTANPMYATSSVDSAVSTLLFSGIVKLNQQNELVNDLAETVIGNDKNDVYTVTLKENLYWHDGEILDADDVLFTYQSIQNPDSKSPLRANWQNVNIEKVDARTVRFTLPHPLSSFPYLMTNGIVPEHILADVAVSQLRNADFNTTNPIGSGPFSWDSIQVNGQNPESREEQIGLRPFANYHGGAPKIERIIIKAVHDENNIIEQFREQEIDAIAGLNSVPENINERDIVEYNFSLNAEVMTFFKISNEVLGDRVVRQALTQAVDKSEILTALGYPVISVDGPLLRSHIGFTDDVKQLAFNKEEAAKILEANGWVAGPDGIRQKGETRLAFQLYSHDNTDYARVADILKRQWQEIGADVELVLQDDTQIQSSIALHNYDALLYGIAVGADPDVYAYWHSTQADARSSNRLNFSELKSDLIDSSLEGGRSRSDPGVRATKYLPFLKEWQGQAPAVGLYQPRFLYITRNKVHGLNSRVLNSSSDRFSNVHNWRIKTGRVTIE